MTSGVLGSSIFEPTLLKPGPTFAMDATPEKEGESREDATTVDNRLQKSFPSRPAGPAPFAGGRPFVSSVRNRKATPGVRVTRTVHFSAAHRLHNPSRPEARTTDVFGPCNSPHWHGHDYEFGVTVRGEVDPATGYVIDLEVLEDIAESVGGDLDHRNLNLDGGWLEGVMPSTENLVVALWNRSGPRLPVGRLVRLVLRDTPRNRAEYTGE